MSEYALKMTGINKSFDGIQVLNNIEIAVKSSEIHALLGENGAGKSTLMNILGGVLLADSGIIEVDGEQVNLHTPSESQHHGIAFIHQELNVVNDLRVYENMFLGYEVHNKFGHLNAQEMIKQSQEIFNYMNIKVDPKAVVGDLDASYKQIIEIAKALLRNATIIIMDEPTTSLTHVEIDNIFKIMRTLKEKGATIIFISHKLGEVVEICDRFTVLRNGEKIVVEDVHGPNGTVSAETIARYMVGRDVLDANIFEKHDVGDVIMEVNNLCCSPYIKDVSFNIRKGEILAFTGLLGDGRTELARAIFGDMKIESGTIKVNGEKITNKSPEKAKKMKFGYLPDNRKENGIVKDLTVAENITLSTLERFQKKFKLNLKEEKSVAKQYVSSLSIKIPSLDANITSLSGGNQQKVVLAKWLHVKPDIMILSNPTQGVDVGAKKEIYGLIMQLAKSGVAVMVMTGEAQEVLKICDRVCVMYHGVIKAELSRNECCEESLMILSTGGSID
ncbi:MAG TPA: sugar ABC transporter ATP-binding protein [Ruminiclostridium sp.]